jgi:CHAD domain-containing protein
MTASTRPTDLLRARLDVFTRLLHKVERGDPRAVHRARVASRRLRELLPVLPADADTSARLSKDLRRVTRALGAIRRLDVMAALVTATPPDGSARQRALADLHDALARARQDAYRRARRKDLERDLRRAAKRLEKLSTRVDGGAPARRHTDQQWRWVVDARIARRAANLERAIDAAGPVYLAGRLHAVRIAVKKLRYAVELADADRTTHADLTKLKRMQELLGGLHDREDLIGWIRDFQGEAPSHDAVVAAALDDLIAALDHECRLLHARYGRARARLLDVCHRLRERAGRVGLLPARPSRRLASVG